jgi:vancomycin permeability regulator SanA
MRKSSVRRADEQKKKSPWKRALSSLLACCLLAVGSCIAVNVYMVRAMKERILPAEDVTDEADCILILGAGVRPNGSPSDMLRGRLEVGVSLYHAQAAPKILVSGDHGSKEYNEVGVMKAYAVNAGVPSEDVFMDHAGFSTYESLWRAKHIFGAERVIIVTQSYHLYRALYVAGRLGLSAVGVSADLEPYGGQTVRDVREFAARVKDFAWCMIQPEPTYTGDPIPLTVSGDVTND